MKSACCCWELRSPVSRAARGLLAARRVVIIIVSADRTPSSSASVGMGAARVGEVAASGSFAASPRWSRWLRCGRAMVSASSPSARVARWAPRRARGGSTRRWERLPPRAAVAREDPSSSSSSPRAGPSARELDAILARVAVMVSAATDMFPAKARETLAAHPELLAARARGDLDFDCDGVAETPRRRPGRDSTSSSPRVRFDSSSRTLPFTSHSAPRRPARRRLARVPRRRGGVPRRSGALVALALTQLGVRSERSAPRVPAGRIAGRVLSRGSRRRRGERPDDVDADVATSLEPALAVLVEDVGRPARRCGARLHATSPNARRARPRFSPSSAGSDPSPPKRSRGGTRGWC